MVKRAVGAHLKNLAFSGIKQALNDERRAVRAQVDEAMQKREDLLLDDASDQKIAELDAETDRRLKLERLDKAEPLLVAELQSLRVEKRRAAWRDLASRFEKTAGKFASKMRDAIEARYAVAAIIGEAQRSGFAPEAASFADRVPARGVTLRAT